MSVNRISSVIALLSLRSFRVLNIPNKKITENITVRILRLVKLKPKIYIKKVNQRALRGYRKNEFNKISLKKFVKK